STMSFALQNEAKYLMQDHDKLGAELQQIYDALYTNIKPEISRIHNRLTQDCVGVIASNRYFTSGDHATAVEICAKSGIYNAKIIAALPIVDMYYGYKWSTVRRSGELLHVAITLDHLLKIVDERTYRTYTRYAIEDLRKAYSCKSIVDLPQRLLEADHPIELIAHLCANTCNLVTIEL